MDDGGIDWGQAEALAFASLLVEGIPIRLSGQDTERGTFSHRHAVLHDQRTGETHAPIQALPDAGASFEIYNSPLSEYACLGFEYGYAVAAPDALVLWEAQYGDFVNGAQIVIDQFLVAGLSKWGQTSRLTLLLPHGYEGNGPEHSSAKLERFLQLAAQENIRVANVTTAAQYFHLLRRQALDATRAPARRDDAEGAAAAEAGGLVAGRPLRGPLRAGDRRSRRRPGRGDEARAHLRQALLRHPGPRGTRARELGRGRPDRAALSVPGRAGRGADRVVPATCASSSGRRRSRRTWAPGGRSATASKRPLPTASTSAMPAGRGARARARATRPPTASSRTGSSARLWPRLSRLWRLRLGARAMSAAPADALLRLLEALAAGEPAAATLGPCTRAARIICRRCAGGSLRQR